MGITRAGRTATARGSRRAGTAALLVVGALGLAGLSACGAPAEAWGEKGGGTTTTTSTTTSTTSPVAARRGTFRLLSYNVAGLPAEISKEDPAYHLPLISPLLEPYDVVLTQEDFDWWAPALGVLDFVHYHERLRAATTHPWRSPRHPGPDTVGLDTTTRPAPLVGDGLGLLSRFPIEGNVRVPWTGCFGGADTSDGGAGDCLAMKGFSRYRVTLADGAVVDVYDVHGEAGATERDQQLQEADFEQLAAFIAANSAGRAVVVAGDTNLHTDLVHPDGWNGADIAVWKAFLRAAGLTDACTATKCSGPGRIDKVAYRSGAGVRLAATHHEFHGDEFVDPTGDALSDHEPLEVVFRWARS